MDSEFIDRRASKLDYERALAKEGSTPPSSGKVIFWFIFCAAGIALLWLSPCLTMFGVIVFVTCWLLGKLHLSSPPVAQLITGTGFYAVDIVGESHYQEILRRICGGRQEDGVEVFTQAALVYEDSNPYDNMAIRIDIGGYAVGYLSRENARMYRKQLEIAGCSGVMKICNAKIVGGWDRGPDDRGSFGVKLDLPPLS